MNREEEMLLELLMKKYNGKNTSPIAPALPKATRLNKGRQHKHRKWSIDEKDFLWVQYNKGASFEDIANVLGIRKKACHSMFYNIKNKKNPSYTPPSIS